MIRIVASFCLIICVYAKPAEDLKCDETESNYYWKDFKNKIPEDALPGGTNSLGRATYMGQVLHQNQIIPAKIDLDADKPVTYEWGYKEFEATENIKILCGKDPEEFEWIDTSNGDIKHNTENKKFIVAGYEPGFTLYIGRKLLRNEIVIGKVVSSEIQTTLNTTKDGIGTQHAEFQVLAYYPKKKKYIACNFDLRSGFLAETEIEITTSVIQ